MYKLKLPILESGYGLSEPASGIAVATKGGFARTRSDIDDASMAVTANYKLTEATYNSLMLFFSTGTNNGADWFLVDLIIDNAVPTEAIAKFVGGPQLTQVQGLNYFASVTYEVRPNAINEAFDNSIVSVFDASGGNPLTYLNLFSPIVNVNWPEA